jgi:hypothetical protein
MGPILISLLTKLLGQTNQPVGVEVMMPKQRNENSGFKRVK